MLISLVHAGLVANKICMKGNQFITFTDLNVNENIIELTYHPVALVTGCSDRPCIIFTQLPHATFIKAHIFNLCPNGIIRASLYDHM